MVEKVADAIENALNESYARLNSNDPSGPYLDDFRNAARAAIEAMREPTEAMQREGLSEWQCATGDGEFETDYDDFRLAWYVMIDAALAEQKTPSREEAQARYNEYMTARFPPPA